MRDWMEGSDDEKENSSNKACPHEHDGRKSVAHDTETRNKIVLKQ